MFLFTKLGITDSKSVTCGTGQTDPDQWPGFFVKNSKSTTTVYKMKITWKLIDWESLPEVKAVFLLVLDISLDISLFTCSILICVMLNSMNIIHWYASKLWFHSIEYARQIAKLVNDSLACLRTAQRIPRADTWAVYLPNLSLCKIHCEFIFSATHVTSMYESEWMP